MKTPECCSDAARDALGDYYVECGCEGSQEYMNAHAVMFVTLLADLVGNTSPETAIGFLDDHITRLRLAVGKQAIKPN